MLPVQADDSYDAVVDGWECRETDRGVPFYIHNPDGKTAWDHPYYTRVMEQLEAHQEVQYAAYRTALKLRHLQKTFGLHLLSLQCLQSVLHDHGFSQGCVGVMDCQSLQLVLMDIFHAPDFRHFDTFRQDVASELLHNYLLNLFDVARSGVVRVLSVKLALAALCNSSLSEKYQYFFREIQSSRAFISRDQLSVFIADLIQIPDLLRESVAFGKNVAATVDSCVQVAGTLGEDVPEKGFYTWLMREPQTLVWLPTLHRLIAAETVKHECKCSVCKTMPMVGFRYKCLKCFKFNICQDCFFHGRVAKNHQVRHPVQEYCLPVTAKDETKVFLKVVRNKMRRRHGRGSKMAFLPVDNTTDRGLLEWEMRPAPNPPSAPSAHHGDGGVGVEGEAASDDSGHSSDQGGEGGSPRSPAPPSPSPGSAYDNSNSPARYLQERQLKKPQSMLQDRHSLIHLVQRLRRENRLLRQQLRGRSCSEDDGEMWKSCATAEVTMEGGVQSRSNTPELRGQGHPEVTPHTHNQNSTALSQTISPIDELSMANSSQQQCYTSDYFNSILGSTTATTAGFDLTAQGLKLTDQMVFASTPAVSASPVLKSGPSKPPRVTGIGDKNTISISCIDVESSSMKWKTENAADDVSHKVQVDGKPSPEEPDTKDTQLDGMETKTLSCNKDQVKDSLLSSPVAECNVVSCDDIWADDTPCTIRKKVAKPTRLASQQSDINMTVTPKTPDTKTRRKSTGSVATPRLPRSQSVQLIDTPQSLKHHASLNRLGFRTPGADRSLFAVARGDSILKTPERQEIDKMIQWIDSAFPADLSYSALSLCQDESTTQSRMLKAAEGIGHAMADLVQATADNCYM